MTNLGTPIVKLAGCDPFEYNNREPIVKIASGASYQVMISSHNRDPLNAPIEAKVGNPYSFIVSDCFKSDIAKRISPVSVTARLSIQNINSKNNQVSFAFSTFPLVIYTATIPNGYYTPTGFGDALIIAMNAEVAAPLQLFTTSWNMQTEHLTITHGSTSYRFEQCSMNVSGIYTMDLQILGAYALAKIIRGMNMLYTPIIYLIAESLSTSSRYSSYSGGGHREYLAAFPIEDGTSRQIIVGASDNFNSTQLLLESSRPLRYLGIALYDIFGESIDTYCEGCRSDYLNLTVQISSA